MNARALDPLRPRRPGGMGRGAMLALVVHLGLLVALAFGVSWRSSEPTGATAELWAAVPQVAAPAAVPLRVTLPAAPAAALAAAAASLALCAAAKVCWTCDFCTCGCCLACPDLAGLFPLAIPNV